jgi:HEAT repeat protein
LFDGQVDGSEELKAKAAHLLARLGPPAIPQLVVEVGRRHGDGSEAYPIAVRAAADMGAPAIPELARLVGTRTTGRVQELAADALSEMGDAAVDVLAPLLAHADDWTSHVASKALARKPVRRAKDVLLRCVRLPNVNVRRNCVDGLRRADWILDRIPSLESPYAAVRAAAEAGLLAEGPAAIPALLDLFHYSRKSSAGLKEAAARMLPRFGPDALPELYAATLRDSTVPSDDGPAAYRAVVGMGHPAVAPLARAVAETNDEDYRRFAFRALGELGDLGVDGLAPFLAHPRAGFRHEAARAFTTKPSPRARAVLLASTRSDDFTVRWYCTSALSRLGDASLAPRFLELLSDSQAQIRASAARGLARIDAAAFRLPLARLACCDSDSMTRDDAAGLLRQSTDPMSKRLGLRYEKPYVRPDLELAITLRNVTKFGFTAGVLAIIGCFALLTGPGASSLAVRAVPACAAAFVIGLVWGRVLPNVWLRVELQFLVLALPLTAACGWVLLRAADGAGSRRTRSWFAIVGSCYAGFAFGWAWLWGFLGF